MCGLYDMKSWTVARRCLDIQCMRNVAATQRRDDRWRIYTRLQSPGSQPSTHDPQAKKSSLRCVVLLSHRSCTVLARARARMLYRSLAQAMFASATICFARAGRLRCTYARRVFVTPARERVDDGFGASWIERGTLTSMLYVTRIGESDTYRFGSTY